MKTVPKKSTRSKKSKEILVVNVEIGNLETNEIKDFIEEQIAPQFKDIATQYHVVYMPMRNGFGGTIYRV